MESSRQFLRSFSRPIAFHRCLVSVCGSITSALFLSQAIYWDDIADDDGWFWKTSEEWEKETGMSRHEQDSARLRLKKLGLIQEHRNGQNGRVHFRVVAEKLCLCLQSTLPKSGNVTSEIRQSTLPKSGNPYKEAENTTREYKETTCNSQIADLPLLEGFEVDVKNPTNRLEERKSKIWEIFPHRKGDPRKTGLKAIEAAIRREAKSRKIKIDGDSGDEASWLIRNAVMLYAKDADTQEKLSDPAKRQFLPMCATWMNQVRYETYLENSVHTNVSHETLDADEPEWEQAARESAKRRAAEKARREAE